jgi:hypothetical protein
MRIERSDRHIRHSNEIKAQGALEYLITHAWSFLILAVVLVVLFNLGIFTGFYTPKGPAGSCLVLRPFGPATTEGISLQGECAGTQPQYVIKFNAPASSANIVAANTLHIYPANTGITISIWFELSSAASTQNIISTTVSGSGSGCGYKLAFQSSNQIYVSDSCPSGTNDIVATYQFGAGTWYNVVAVVGPTTPVGGTGSIPANIYVDDVNYASGSISHWAQPNTWTNLTIGAGYGSSQSPNFLANLQIYNSSLSAADVREIYLDGIGGSPINLQSINGWWPLNGDVMDYSGNNNNAHAVSIAYQSGWNGGYTTP